MIVGLFILALIFHVADWAQTRVIAKRPEHWRELNPILGVHPTRKAVNAYFATAGLLLSALAAALLVGPYQNLGAWLLTGWVLVGGGAVVRNHFLGIKV